MTPDDVWQGHAPASLPPAFPGSAKEASADLPHNYEAEQGLLGALLVNNRAMDRVPAEMRPDHFADPLHGRIFEVLRETIDRGQLANPITLKRAFEGEEAAPGLSIAQYLVKLSASIVAIVNAEDYARTIIDLWSRRAVILACQEIMADARGAAAEKEGAQIIDEAEARIHELTASDRVGKKGLVPIGEEIDDTLQMIQTARDAGGISGLSTGFIDLDRRTAGLQPGSLVILGGRPSMGKSDLAINIALSAAERGERVGFFSLEMSRGLLVNRALARAAGISATDQIGGKVSDDDLRRLALAAGKIRALPLSIDDAPAPTVDIISSRARRLQRRHGLDLVVVDYLQLIAPGNNRRSRETNRTTDVTMISQGLKALAKDLNVPVIALCQLSRAVELREDKHPQLSDLRESGGIEQDADVVMFVYRDSYYLEREQPRQRPKEGDADFAERRNDHERKLLAAMNICEVVIAKQRMGAVGSVNLFYKAAHSLFGDLGNGGEG